MMEDKRFDGLMFPVHKVDKEMDIIKIFPALEKHNFFVTYPKKHRTQVIQYLFYLYDKNSPLLKEYKDLEERKDAALSLAQFERLKDGSWPTHLEDIKKFRDEKFFNMALGIMRIQHNAKLTMIHTFEEMFNEYHEMLLKPTAQGNNKNLSPQDMKALLSAVDQKKKIREECMSIKDDLDLLYEQVYGDNEDLQDLIVRKKMSTPEQVAELIAS